jgi:hypothetical protein
MVGERPLVDVADRLAPAVEELDDVVATDDFGHGDQQATVLVDRHPGFGIGDIEIGVWPVHLARLAVEELVPHKPLFVEIDLLLAGDQQAAKQVDVGVADILVAGGHGENS